jgi:hypothetical protein
VQDGQGALGRQVGNAARGPGHRQGAEQDVACKPPLVGDASARPGPVGFQLSEVVERRCRDEHAPVGLGHEDLGEG